MSEVVILPIVTCIGGFLAGIYMNAAGKYFADKCTDQRKRQEDDASMRKLFGQCGKQMPELFVEMKNDLTEIPLNSEFVLLNIDATCGLSDEPFSYYYTTSDRSDETYEDNATSKPRQVHSQLVKKVKILQDAEFITNIETNPENVPRFRMSLRFKNLLAAM
jgi:hypothetical protein